MTITGPASEALSEMLRTMEGAPVTALGLVRRLTAEDRDEVYAAAAAELAAGLRAEGVEIPEHPDEEREWLRDRLRLAANLADFMTLSSMLAAMHDEDQG